MTHPFDISEEITLDATPDQIWAAIATGPGIDSWFMGHTEVEPVEGGRTIFSMGDFSGESTITAWEPGKRFAYRGEPAPDGAFMAFEYLIEARDGGSSVVHFVHSGLLGDDWEAEYDALRVGDRMYLRKLGAYVAHFAGRTSKFDLMLFGPPAADKVSVRAAFADALGVSPDATGGEPARLHVDGLPPTEGVIDFADRPPFMGMRTADSMVMLIHGYQDAVVVNVHSFADDAPREQVERAWQGWLDRTFGPAA
jgi:uncharacterized protein YndB with AHSA1/START domain